MAEPEFYKQVPAMTLAEIAAFTQGQLIEASRADQRVAGLAALDEAGPMHLGFFDNLKYQSQLAGTHAGACLVSARFVDKVPSHVAAIQVTHPFRAFVKLARHYHEDALRPQSWFDITGIAASAVIHPTAHLEDDVTVDPLAVIGPDVEIGSGTVVGSGAVIGAHVRIGRNCNIGAGTTIQYALIGNDVLIHPGCHIGQDGFGFTPENGAHTKVPQARRVLIQNNVEIGAGSTVDRGSLRDTVIGEGTKIDNLVQIGHNVVIGRHCLLAAHVGLGGSLTLEDYVALGAKVGINNHLRIGAGAQITAMSGVAHDIPPKARWGGLIARPTKQWFREMGVLERLARERRPRADAAGTDDDKGGGQD